MSIETDPEREAFYSWLNGTSRAGELPIRIEAGDMDSVRRALTAASWLAWKSRSAEVSALRQERDALSRQLDQIIEG